MLTVCCRNQCEVPGIFKMFNRMIFFKMNVKRSGTIFLGCLGILVLLNLQVYGQSVQESDPLTQLDQILHKISIYDYNASRGWLDDFRNLMKQIYNSPGTKAEAEVMMIEFLQSEATIPGKQVVCQELGPIATNKSVPVLSSMLDDSNTAEMALFALNMIPDNSVDKILRDHLDKADMPLIIGLINSIGSRQNTKAIPQLQKLAHNEDLQIAVSAIHALGLIHDDKTTRILDKLFKNCAPPLKWNVADSYLKTADHIYASGKKKDAFEIYHTVYMTNPPLSILIAALQGVLKDPQNPPEEEFNKIFQEGDDNLIDAILPVIRDYPGALEFFNLEGSIETLDPKQQINLLIAFSERGETKIRRMVIGFLEKGNPEEMIAALLALFHISEPGDHHIFAIKAALATGQIKEFARSCLYQLKGKEVDQQILQSITATSVENWERLELIRSVGERNIEEGVDIILESARSPDRRIRVESIKTLGKIGKPKIIDQVIELLITAHTRQERNEAISTITLIAGKNPNIETRSDEILAIVKKISDNETQISLIEVLGNIGSDGALPVLRDFLNHPDNDIQYSTIKSLSRWPNDDPAMDLKEIFENSEDIKKHTLALQGYVQLLSISESLTEDQKAMAFQKAFYQALNLDEKKIILSAMGNIGSLKALEMSVGLISDKDLQLEAEASIINMSDKISNRFLTEKRKWLERAIEGSDNENFKNNVKEIIKWLE